MKKYSLLIWHYVVSVKLTVKISSFFVAFSENTNFNKKLNILDFKHISKVTLSEDFPHTCRPLHWVWDTYLTAMYAIVCVDPRLYFTPHSRSFPYTCKLLACTIGSSLQLKSSCLSPKHIVFSVYTNNMHLTNPVSGIGETVKDQKSWLLVTEWFFNLFLEVFQV